MEKAKVNTTYDFVHLILHASGGHIEGRTKLQKLVYFVGVLTGHGGGFGYRAHYYGPYSSDVSVAVDELRGLGFLTKTKTSFGAVDSRGFEVTRFDYELTEPGKVVADEKAQKHQEVWRRIVAAVKTLKDAKAEDYVKLSIAAKAHFMRTEKQQNLSPDELSQQTSSYGWSVTPEQFREADQLLSSITSTRNSKD
jgi:uncharacterized protein YwgA